MIPLHKLESLPRHQMLRKMLKIFTEAELRLLSNAPEITKSDTTYLLEVAGIMSSDPSFSPEAHQQIIEMVDAFAFSQAGDTRRLLNTLKHILRMEVGIQTADWDFVDQEGKLSTEKRTSFPGLHVFLEDIRSPYNVGSLFRSAESFGVEKIYLSPLCASPEHQRAKRTAMGCVDLLPWSRSTLEALPRPMFALETGGTSLDEFSFPARGTLIVGSEELGVSPEALAAVDGGRVSIPTYGAKGSLNVSAAFAIVMRAWARSYLNDPAYSLA